MFIRKAPLLCSTCFICLAYPVEALSQTAPAENQVSPASAAATSAQYTDRDEIIVTARRRGEDLSKTPVSVAVVSAETLARANITNEYDLRQAAPGLQIRAGQDNMQVNFSLRGFSQDPYSNARPGVLAYVNDVQISSNFGLTAFYDLDSIQVLKGPQGTLFGRSTTGGALLYTTAKPTNTLGGYASGLYGNYNQYKIEGAINVPLIDDKLLLRVAGFAQGQDGYQQNIYIGNTGPQGGNRQYGFRGSLTAKLGPNITNDLVVGYLDSKFDNVIGVISGLLPYTGVGAPYVPTEFLYAGTATPTATITGECTVQAFAGLGPCPPVNPLVAAYYTSYFANPNHNVSLTQVLADQNARGPYVISSEIKSGGFSRSVVVTNTTTIDVAPGMKIKNIFGYTDSKGQDRNDGDGTPFALSTARGDGELSESRAVSDELQFAGTSGRADFVVGVFFSDERARKQISNSFFDIVLGGSGQTLDSFLTSRTYAGYGQLTYRLNDSGLSATVGGRFTSERVGRTVGPNDVYRAALGPIPPAGFSYDKSRLFNTPSWTFGLQYQVSPSTLLYLASRRSYKSGGYNNTVQPKDGDASIGGDAYGKERVTDVEFGAKFAGHVGSMPVRANLALYHSWIKDSQRAAEALIAGNPATVTVNVPNGKVYGLEFDGMVRPASWLTLGGSLNYTHTAYGNQPLSVNGNSQVFDIFPDTPLWTGNPYVDVTVPMTNRINLLLHGDAYFQSSTSTSPRSANIVGTQIAPYAIANFRLGLQDSAAGWSLTANLKNAFKKVYYIGGLQTGEIYQVNTLLPGMPRTFTIEARFKF